MIENGPTAATSDLLQSLGADLKTLIQQELRDAQDELLAKARRAGQSGALLGASGVLGVLALGSSAVLLQRILDRFLPPVTAAAVASGLYAAGAGALASAGLAELRRALPLVPRETVTDLQRDVRAATDRDVPPATP
jgi:hypothetical protein